MDNFIYSNVYGIDSVIRVGIYTLYRIYVREINVVNLLLISVRSSTNSLCTKWVWNEASTSPRRARTTK